MQSKILSIKSLCVGLIYNYIEIFPFNYGYQENMKPCCLMGRNKDAQV